MLISAEMIGTAIVSISVTSVFGYIAFRVTLESRMNSLEHEIEILKPIRTILLHKGSEQVEKFFQEREQ